MGRRVLILLALSALVAVVVISLSTIMFPSTVLAPDYMRSTPIATFDPNVTPTITPTAPATPR